MHRRRFIAALATGATATAAGWSVSTERPSAAHVQSNEAAVTSTATPADVSASRTGTAGSTSANEQSTSPYTRVYRATIPSVVLVRTYANGPTGLGSGFSYGDGFVVTNQHVVAGASTVRVQFREGEWRVADVVGTDIYSDLAVLGVKNRPAHAEPLSFSRSEPPVGTRVVAIGAPFDLGGSVSAGIISGQDRALPAANGFTIPDAVQTDAAVNPGNSGGPLVTLDGDVAGVVNAGAGDSIGFAISAALAKRVVPALVADGAYRHPYLGVQVQDVTPLVAEANGLGRARGVLVVRALPNGPAAGALRGSDEQTTVAGVSVPTGGDVVVGLAGRGIDSRADLSTALALETSPGQTIPVTVFRDGRRTTVEVTLGVRPES